MSRFPMDRSSAREVDLVRQDRGCPACGAKMRIQCKRTRPIHTLQGPVHLIIKLLQCRNMECDSTTTFGPEQEAEYAMPTLQPAIKPESNHPLQLVPVTAEEYRQCAGVSASGLPDKLVGLGVMFTHHDAHVILLARPIPTGTAKPENPVAPATAVRCRLRR